MNISELLTVIDSNAYLNLVSEKKVAGYMKAKLFLYHLIWLERKVKLVDIRNEFFIIVED